MNVDAKLHPNFMILAESLTIKKQYVTKDFKFIEFFGKILRKILVILSIFTIFFFSQNLKANLILSYL